MNEPVLLGGCLCGSVRYQIHGALGLAEHCHCSMCRKAHGAAFSSNALVATANLTIIAGAELVSQYESSPNRHKCFCSKCGSQLFIRRLNKSEYTVVSLGTIDGDPGVKPERHVFVGSCAAWFGITDGLPQYTVYPGFEPEVGAAHAEPSQETPSK